MGISLKILIFFLTCSSVGAETLTTFNLVNGSFKYSSDKLSGTSNTTGSPSIGFLYSFNEKNQFGSSLDVFFNTKTQAVSLYGLSLIYHYSFIGRSAVSVVENKDLKITTIDKWNHFFISKFKRYTYYLGSNKTDETRFDQNGDFFNFDLGVGSSYYLGNRLRICAELTSTIYAFASSDDRIKFKSTLLSIGLQKEF